MISVVMPFHNARETIAEAVDSIKAQTVRDWELVAVDDGSTDGSAELVREFARRDERIRLVQRRHEGIVAALRAGCDRARGELIARMDADDRSMPERFGAQRELLRLRPEVGLCGTHVRMFGERVGSGRREYEAWLNNLTGTEKIERDIYIECPIAHPAFLMRREVYEEVGGYRERGWPEDYDLVLRVRESGWKLANVGRVLLEWRESGERLSMRSDRYSAEAFRALKREFLWREFLAGDPPFLQWGAGQVGKRWLREWPEGRRPEAVIDVSEKKIGSRIHGVPVIAPEAIPVAGKYRIVAAVGAPGARELIRDFLRRKNYRESRDFRMLA